MLRASPRPVSVPPRIHEPTLLGTPRAPPSSRPGDTDRCISISHPSLSSLREWCNTSGSEPFNRAGSRTDRSRDLCKHRRPCGANSRRVSDRSSMSSVGNVIAGMLGAEEPIAALMRTTSADSCSGRAANSALPREGFVSREQAQRGTADLPSTHPRHLQRRPGRRAEVVLIVERPLQRRHLADLGVHAADCGPSRKSNDQGVVGAGSGSTAYRTPPIVKALQVSAAF